MRAGVAAIVIGLAVEALWPHYRIGALHILFISGFSFIVLTVSIRVIFGHSGNAHLFEKPLPFLHRLGGLIFLAMISRYVADIAPASAHHSSCRGRAFLDRRNGDLDGESAPESDGAGL